MVGPVAAGLPLIDEVARDAYRRRLVEVEDDIDEATQMNDLGRIELAQRDRDYLIAELTSAIYLAFSGVSNGLARISGTSSER